MPQLFTFSDYRAYVKARIAKDPARGYQRRLATAAGCNPSYLSQVLNSHVQLTPDHAARLAAYWRFDDEETDYFLTLVELDRCASTELRRHLTRRITAAQRSRQRVTQRVENKAEISLERQVGYFAQPMTAAIHLATRIADLRRPIAIAERLGIPEDFVLSTLETLKSLGLVQGGPQQWQAVDVNLHVPDTSPLTNANHANWRQEAIQRLHHGNRDGTHYTALYTLGREEFAQIREELLELIERSRRMVLSAKDETLSCFQCDFWEL